MTVAVWPTESVAVPVTVAVSRFSLDAAVRVATLEVIVAPAPSVNVEAAAVPKLNDAGAPVPVVSTSWTEALLIATEPVLTITTRSYSDGAGRDRRLRRQIANPNLGPGGAVGRDFLVQRDGRRHTSVIRLIARGDRLRVPDTLSFGPDARD